MEHSNGVINLEIKPTGNGNPSMVEPSTPSVSRGQLDSEFEAGYIAAALLMSASNDEREEILNIGRVFSQSSNGARTKFAQLIESIRDDNLLIRALGFVGTKL